MSDFPRAEALAKCELFLKADNDFREEIDSIVKRVRPLFPAATLVNPAWQNHTIDGVHMVGSRAEGALIPSMIKTRRPSFEMDVMIEILPVNNPDDLERLIWIDKNIPGYVFPYFDELFKQLPDETRSKIEKYISEGKVSMPDSDTFVSTEWVKKLTALAMDVSGDKEVINQLISKISLPLRFDLQTEFHGAAVNWILSLTWNDELLLEISIDAVIVAQVNVWPKQAEEWPTRKRHWPPEQVVQQAMKKGWQIVPKPWKKDMAYPGFNEHAWRQTFTRAEVVVCQARSPRQMLVYLIAKTIFYAHVRMEMDGYVFSSYPLKTSFLWMLEETPPNEWDEECPFTLARRLYAKLLRYLEEGMLPYYFIPSINILNEEPAALLKEGERIVRMVASNPKQYLPLTAIDDVIHKVENLIQNTEAAMVPIPALAREVQRRTGMKYEEADLD